MRRIMTLLFLSCFLLAGCGKEETKPEDPNRPNVCDMDCDPADMSEYPTFQEEDHVFLKMTMKEANECLQDASFSGILYYGYVGCPWCEEAVPIMNDVAKSLSLSIYYVNKQSEENLANPQWEEEAITLLDEAYGLKTDATEEVKLYVPEVVVVQEGKVIAHHLGTVEGHDAHEREMNEDEQKLLESIYKKMFKKLKS